MEIQFLLENVPFFQGLSSTDIEPLETLFQEKKIPRGSIIFFEGDIGEEFYIILSGAVKIFRFDRQKEVILSILRTGDYFGEMALFHEHRIRSATAETLEPTALYMLDRKTLYSALESNNKLTLKLLQITMERLRKADEKIEDLTFLDVRSRIIKNILNLSLEFGLQTENGVLIDFKLTHQQLADMIGSVRETVTKVLLDLQVNGLIEINQRKIIVKDPQLLQARMAQANQK